MADTWLDQLFQAIEDGRFEAATKMMDDQELEVRPAAPRRRRAEDDSRRSDSESWPDRPDPRPQDPGAFETLEWPHALHMLLHMHAFRL
jgi:hypothetical protein